MKISDNSITINHEGIVHKTGDNSVLVSLLAATSCSGCHAEGSCTLSGREEKIIEVPGSYNVKPGDKVTILMKQSMGFAALAFGYLLPLISVLVVLILLISLKVPEFAAGLTSFAILIPYYTILYFFRKQIDKKFIFMLKV